MRIQPVTISDIPRWEALAAGYDMYVAELVGDLTEWYEGNGEAMAFTAYMRSKIAKEEAFMAIDPGGRCLGIIAFSKSSNRITFFGISPDADLSAAGGALLRHAFQHLNASCDIRINKIASPSTWIEQHRKLLIRFGFTPVENVLENGVPVNVYLKPSSA